MDDETAELLADPVAVAEIAEGRADAAAGNVVGEAEIRAVLERRLTAGRPGSAAPTKTLDGVATAFERQATVERMGQFEAALDAAWRAATSSGDPAPLVDFVERWWPEAAGWALDPAGMRAVYEEMARIKRDGLNPWLRARLAEHPEGMTRERAIASWEAANGRPMRRVMPPPQ